MFPPNSKVVCVDDRPPAGGSTAPRLLVRGDVYNVQETDPPRWPGDAWGVRVTGFPTFWVGDTETYWSADRFRMIDQAREMISARKAEPVPA